jgi:hypothetical protein
MKRRGFLSATAGAAAGVASACVGCARGCTEPANIRFAPTILEIAEGRAPDSVQGIKPLKHILSGQAETAL